MKSTAKRKALNASPFNASEFTNMVLVFSTSTETIHGFKIETSTETEGNFSWTMQLAYSVNVNSTIKADFITVARLVKKFKASRSVHYTGNMCPTVECLTTPLGFGEVTTWLQAKFIVPATMHTVVRSILNSIVRDSMSDYKVTVCFDDNKCVEFQFVNLFSVGGWKTTGKTSTTGGGSSGGSNTGSNGSNGFTIKCSQWYTYTGTTADGTYCEGWVFADLP